MKYTQNYNLKKPDVDDFYNVNDMNENMELLDEELKKNADEIGLVKNDITELNEKLPETPLVGSTSELRPEDVAIAMEKGVPIYVTHTDSMFGNVAFNYFSYSLIIGNKIVSSVVFEFMGLKFCAQLFGDLDNNTWEFNAIELAGLDDLAGYALKENAVYYVVGGGTTDSNNKVSTWTGSHDSITEYYEGLTIAYKVGVAGDTTTTLNINNLGAVDVVKNVSTGISTSYAVNSVVMLIYTTDDGKAYWKTADYDANTKTTTGSSNKASTKMYLVGGTSQSSSGVTTYTNKNCYIGTDNRLYSDGVVVPNVAEITALIQEQLGVIENGTY